MLGNGTHDRCLLRAHGQAIACVFHVASGHDFPGLQKHRRTDVKVAVGCVGMARDFGCLLPQLQQSGVAYFSCFICCRHCVLRLNPGQTECKPHTRPTE